MLVLPIATIFDHEKKNSVNILKKLRSSSHPWCIDKTFPYSRPKFFFLPWHPKVPVTQLFLNFITGSFCFFTCILSKIVTGMADNFTGFFFQNFHGQVGKVTGILKNSCHGHFEVCHGHFCALISNFWFTALTTKAIFGVSFVANLLFA